MEGNRECKGDVMKFLSRVKVYPRLRTRSKNKIKKFAKYILADIY